MSPDSTVIDRTADSLGIDSLIAVEMRSWLLKGLGVDLPLLVIIGGNNMAQVLEACRARLDSAVTPLLETGADQAIPSGEQISQGKKKELKSRESPLTVSSVHPVPAPMVETPSIAVIAVKQAEITSAPSEDERSEVKIPAANGSHTDAAKTATTKVNEHEILLGAPSVGNDALHGSNGSSCSEDGSSEPTQQIMTKDSIIEARRVHDGSPQTTLATHRKGLFSRMLRSRRIARLRQYL